MLNNMERKKLTKYELDEIMELFIENRDTFYWLITFEEFVKDYVVKCEECGEFFVTDMNDKICEKCREHVEEEIDDDFEYFDRNKEHIYYGLEY